MTQPLLSPQAKVGLFLTMGLTLLLIASFFLGGWRFRWERGRIYYAELPDAHRIGPESHVELSGVRIGKVEAIELDPKTYRVRAKLRIRRDLQLYDDALLRIRTSGFLGDRFLEIDPGRSGKELPEGSLIPRSVAPLSLEEILDSLTPVVENLKAITADLQRVSGSPQFQEGITVTLAHLEQLSNQLNKLVEGNRENLNRIVADIRETLSYLKIHLPRLSQELFSGVREARSTIGELRPVLQRIGDRIDKISGDFENTISRINAVIARVEQGEGTVGTLLTDRDTAENVREAASTLGSIARSYRELRTIIEYRGQAENLPEVRRWGFRHTLNIRIQPDPEKYYALGLVHAPRLVENLTVRTTTSQDPRTGAVITETTTREVIGEDKFLFNLYLARTFFSFLTVRGGIIESSGGVGLDLHILPEIWTIRGELFGFPVEGGAPYLRSWTELRLFRHLNLTAGLEDILTPPRARRYSLGAGVIFDDKDLKTLFLALPRISF